MYTRFVASQGVEIAVPEQPIPIQHYLRQPQRLVHALADPSRVELLSEDCFRLAIRPLSFMNLSIQPTVDLRVWAEREGTVHLESIACEIRGVEYINQRSSLNLVGQLSPVLLYGVTHLQGQANLEVKVELPPPFSFMPRPLLEATGNGLLKSVLLTIKQRLMHQLLLDYRRWVQAQSERTTVQPTHLPVNSPTT